MGRPVEEHLGKRLATRDHIMSTRQHIHEAVRSFLWEESGTTAVEYAVMLAMILCVIIITIGSFGAGQHSMWGKIDSDMQAHGIN